MNWVCNLCEGDRPFSVPAGGMVSFDLMSEHLSERHGVRMQMVERARDRSERHLWGRRG